MVLLVEFAPPQTVVEIGFPQPEEQTGLIGRAVEGSLVGNPKDHGGGK